MEKGVSVVVCCFNSALRLPETIKYLALQDVPSHISWEVIIVNNNSTDNTKEVAQAEWNKYNCQTDFVIVDEPNPGLSHAREKGIFTAKYEYVVFCDDDNWLSDNYVRDVFKLFKENPTVHIIGGNSYLTKRNTYTPEWFYRFNEAFAVGIQGNTEELITNSRGWVWGAGMAINAKTYKKILNVGFKFSLSDRKGSKLVSGHDSEICLVYRLMEHDILFSNSLIIYHDIPHERIKWDYMKKLYFNGGISDLFLYPYTHILNKSNKIKFTDRWIIKTTMLIFSLTSNLYFYIKIINSKKEGYGYQLSVLKRINYIYNFIMHPFYIEKKIDYLNKIKLLYKSNFNE